MEEEKEITRKAKERSAIPECRKPRAMEQRLGNASHTALHAGHCICEGCVRTANHSSPPNRAVLSVPWP